VANPKSARRIPASAVAAAALAGGAIVLALTGWRWSVAAGAAVIRRRYPSVRRVSPAALATWLDSGRTPPVILDVRTRAEFETSHLPGARHFPAMQASAALRGLAKDAAVVTYCSVGYRASAVAERLLQAGIPDVRVLDGSIFRWANEGRPLIRPDGQRAAKVHPWSNGWKWMLHPDRR
jgi:rhodanese-related sulfurtransferase